MMTHRNFILNASATLVVFIFGLFVFTYKTETVRGQSATSTPVMTGFCSVSVSPQERNNTYDVRWEVDLGPNGNDFETRYEWQGLSTSTNSGASLREEHSTPGLKTKQVTATNGSLSATLRCSALLPEPNFGSDSSNELRASCIPTVEGMTVRWRAVGKENGEDAAFSWVDHSSDGFRVSTSSGEEITHTYTTEGIKEATVSVRGSARTITLTCSAKVAPGGEEGGCFIATAAFGTSMNKEVLTLRKFRDEKLLTNIAGRKFVRAYYEISPSIADFIRDKEALKSITRLALKPIVWLVE